MPSKQLYDIKAVLCFICKRTPLKKGYFQKAQLVSKYLVYSKSVICETHVVVDHCAKDRQKTYVSLK